MRRPTIQWLDGQQMKGLPRPTAHQRLGEGRHHLPKPLRAKSQPRIGPSQPFPTVYPPYIISPFFKILRGPSAPMLLPGIIGSGLRNKTIWCQKDYPFPSDRLPFRQPKRSLLFVQMFQDIQRGHGVHRARPKRQRPEVRMNPRRIGGPKAVFDKGGKNTDPNRSPGAHRKNAEPWRRFRTQDPRPCHTPPAPPPSVHRDRREQDARSTQPSFARVQWT